MYKQSEEESVFCDGCGEQIYHEDYIFCYACHIEQENKLKTTEQKVKELEEELESYKK